MTKVVTAGKDWAPQNANTAARNNVATWVQVNFATNGQALRPLSRTDIDKIHDFIDTQRVARPLADQVPDLAKFLSGLPFASVADRTYAEAYNLASQRMPRPAVRTSEPASNVLALPDGSRLHFGMNSPGVFFQTDVSKIELEREQNGTRSKVSLTYAGRWNLSDQQKQHIAHFQVSKDNSMLMFKAGQGVPLATPVAISPANVQYKQALKFPAVYLDMKQQQLWRPDSRWVDVDVSRLALELEVPNMAAFANPNAVEIKATARLTIETGLPQPSWSTQEIKLTRVPETNQWTNGSWTFELDPTTESLTLKDFAFAQMTPDYMYRGTLAADARRFARPSPVGLRGT